MQSILVVLLVGLIGGIAVGLQGPLASLVGSKLGAMESVFIVHLGGAIAGAIGILIQRNSKLGEWRSVPWYALVAGIFGMVVIAAISYAIPRVGATATIALVVAGQLVVSVTLDHFGWLGVDVRPIDIPRVAGIIVLFVGVWLIIR
jgi:bacterial/archaeal transporter family-2 protein